MLNSYDPEDGVSVLESLDGVAVQSFNGALVVGYQIGVQLLGITLGFNGVLFGYKLDFMGFQIFYTKYGLVVGL